MLRADARRASRELDSQYLKRRYTPFAKQLRYHRYDNAHELAEVGEACLAELRHAKLLLSSAFFPGDQVTVEVVLKGHERGPERNLIYDVDGGCYEMWQISVSGALFKRGPRTVCPSNMIEIRACDAPLNDELRKSAEFFRERAKRFVSNATKEGRLDTILERVRKSGRFRLSEIAK